MFTILKHRRKSFRAVVSSAANGLSEGLIRAYLGEDLTDELANANLTVRGTSAASTTGKDNNCYTYPNNGGHVTDWFPDGNPWTVSCWMNADSIHSATYNGTVGCHDDNDHRVYWGLGNSNEAVVAVGNTAAIDSAVTYSSGTWYNFITIWDGTNAWGFINGELRLKFAPTFSGTSTDALHLGERIYNGGSDYTEWDGKQDETYIWNRALDVGSASSVGDTGGGDIAELQSLFYASFDREGTVTLDSDVLLYVPFTDTNASTGADGYVLNSGTHKFTSAVFARAGNAVINTDQTKMNGSATAAYGPGAADADGWELDSTISTGLEVGTTSPLSIQFWFYCLNDGSGSSARLLGWDGWYTSGTGIEFETLSSDFDRFIFYEFTGSGGSRRSIGDHVLNANAWNHIYWAFQPSGSSYLGINGTVVETSGSYITDFAPTVDLNLLKTPADADDSVKGYIQEFIVKNTVPYTANFTPTTVPLLSLTYYSIVFGNNVTMSVSDPIPDGKQGSFSAWIKMHSGSSDSTTYYIMGNTSNKFYIRRLSSGIIQIVIDGVGNLGSDVSVNKAGGWYHIAASWDATTSASARLYINGSSALSSTTLTDATIDYASGSWKIGDLVSGSSKWYGSMSEVWLTDEYIDFNIAGNIEKFSNGLSPVNLGSDGSTPTSTAARIYLRNPYDEFTTNSGSAGNFTIDTGSFGDGGADKPGFPTTNLVAFYKLDESSGDALDISGNARTFTDNGTVASTTGSIGGETVNVRSLDRAAGKYFSRADDDNLDVGDGESFTISFWAKVSSSWDNYSSGGVFSKRNAVGASDAGYSIDLRIVNSDVYIRYNGVSDGSTTVGDTNTDTGVATDAWAHYMMVFTADATVITYVNNAQYNSDDASSVTGSLANSIPSYIGQRAYNSTGSSMFDVSHIGFWKKALTSTERAGVYNSGKVFAPGAPVPLQTRTVTYDSSDAAVFTIDSDSGQKIWSDQKLNQANIFNGLRLWNGSEAGNSGATADGTKWEFSSGGDCTTWWDNYWMRVKQDPDTGTFSDWINLTGSDGLIKTSCQPTYNNIGTSVTHYSGPGTWTTHAAGFRYQVEIYSVSSRPQ